MVSCMRVHSSWCLSYELHCMESMLLLSCPSDPAAFVHWATLINSKYVTNYFQVYTGITFSLKVAEDCLGLSNHSIILCLPPRHLLKGFETWELGTWIAGSLCLPLRQCITVGSGYCHLFLCNSFRFLASELRQKNIRQQCGYAG